MLTCSIFILPCGRLPATVCACVGARPVRFREVQGQVSKHLGEQLHVGRFSPGDPQHMTGLARSIGIGGHRNLRFVGHGVAGAQEGGFGFGAGVHVGDHPVHEVLFAVGDVDVGG